jgi:predicted SprT family Zn-dependent metalloprotease
MNADSNQHTIVQRLDFFGQKGWIRMQPVDAKEMAWKLLREHALIGWRFQFDHARRRFGSCRLRTKLITLSKPLTLLNSQEQVRDTLLHEIAHALTPGDGHGPKWKAKCREIGAAPKRCYSESEVAAPPRRPARYSFGCPACNWWVPRRKRTAGKYLCKQCRGPVRLVERASMKPVGSSVAAR